LVYVFRLVPQGAALYDVNTGQLLVDFAGSIYDSLIAAFTSDGTSLIVAPDRVFVLDMATLLAGSPIDQAVTLEMPSHNGFVLRISVSPDDSRLVTGASSELLKLWDLTTGHRLAEFGGAGTNIHDGAFHPTLPHILVTTWPNEVRIHTLDPDELIAIAESRLSREMTEDECQQYFRRPCDDS